METKIDLSFGPTKSKQLLADYFSKKITMEELETECAYWLLTDECFRELRPAFMPTRPQILIDYDNSTPARKESINKDPNFWNQPEVFRYVSEKERVKNFNNACIFKLRDAKKHIPEKDFIAHKKIEGRLYEFMDFVSALPKPNWQDRETGEEG